MEVLKIKDWLKEQSEKQFEFIEPIKNWNRVRRLKDNVWFTEQQTIRLKDNVWFTEQQTIGYKGNLYTIEEFNSDMVHVLIKTKTPLSDVGFYSVEGIVQINELNK